MKLHATWLSLFVGILLVACQQNGPTTLGPEPGNPVVPADKPNCQDDPSHPSCKDDDGGGADEGGKKADALVELLGEYETTGEPFPVIYDRHDHRPNGHVSFTSTRGDLRSVKLNIPSFEEFSTCRGSSDTDRDFTPAEQAALWNAIVDADPDGLTPPANPADRNYFARVEMGPEGPGNPSWDEENRINGGHETIDDSGDEIRWIYRLGTSPLFEEKHSNGELLVKGTWDPDNEVITLTEGVVHFTKWNMTDGTRTRVACVNDVDPLVVSVSNRCDNESPAC